MEASAMVVWAGTVAVIGDRTAVRRRAFASICANPPQVAQKSQKQQVKGVKRSV
jgi:hypothetical protein